MIFHASNKSVEINHIKEKFPMVNILLRFVGSRINCSNYRLTEIFKSTFTDSFNTFPVFSHTKSICPFLYNIDFYSPTKLGVPQQLLQL